MRLLILLIMCLVVNTGYTQTKLDSAFIRSLQKGDFNQLKPFLPTRALYKSLEKDNPQKTDAAIDAFLLKNTARLKENWNKVLQNIRSNKLNLKQVNPRETLLHPLQPGSPVLGLVLVYEYGGKLFDDFTLIVSMYADKTWLLEIPNPTSFLQLRENGLRNSTEARNAILLNDPGFKEKMAAQVSTMIRQAAKDSLEAFAAAVLFHQPGDTSSWKRPVRPAVAAELDIARNLMAQVLKITGNCNDWQSQELMLEKESEGTWLIQPVKCGDKQVYFAFMLLNDRLFLGDTDQD